MTRSALAAGGLALLAIALPGCFGDDAGVFGPVAGADDAAGDATPPPLLFKAKPARGPAPLTVEFSLDVAGDGSLPWSLDFGDGSRLAKGDDMPANVSHEFTDERSHDVIATVGSGELATRSRVTIVVLPPGSVVEDPEEEAEGEPIPESSSTSDTTSGSEEGEDGDQGDASSTSSGPGGSTATPTPTPTPPPDPEPTPTPTSTTSQPTSTAAPPSTTSAPPPSSGNQPPRATITASPSGGAAPLDVAYTIDASDPEGQPIQWSFDVEDDGILEASGTRSNVPRTIGYHFDSPGTYVAVLRVSDGVTTTTRTITVTAS